LVTKSAIRPGSNFNRQGGSIFHQRQQLPFQVEDQLSHGRIPSSSACGMMVFFIPLKITLGPQFPTWFPQALILQR
ncbi:hypothetical protein, partial [Pseudomonas aeruginosa]|uniref:hypothetical protein n=1 Tax=Pseudomonas aeruginosa TaxID=287 RepID=UPI001C94E2E5